MNYVGPTLVLSGLYGHHLGMSGHLDGLNVGKLGCPCRGKLLLKVMRNNIVLLAKKLIVLLTLLSIKSNYYITFAVLFLTWAGLSCF